MLAGGFGVGGGAFPGAAGHVFPAAAPAPMPSNAQSISGQNVNVEPVIRSKFPETWIWSDAQCK